MRLLGFEFVVCYAVCSVVCCLVRYVVRSLSWFWFWGYSSVMVTSWWFCSWLVFCWWVLLVVCGVCCVVLFAIFGSWLV